MSHTRNPGEDFRIASDVDGEPLIVKQSISGRGHGLIAPKGKKFSARETVLWIRRPLAMTLETSKLQEVCYQCFRRQAVDDKELQIAANGGLTLLKSCVGCHTVKYCGKTCQSRSWKEHHKYECKIYGALQPRVLPSPVRTILRILKLRSNGHVNDQQWQDLLALESHQDHLSTLGGQPWQDLFLMAKATQKYSGTTEPMKIIVRICCILTMNSFTLTDALLEPLGLALDPMAAMLNHSCDPNCIVRFDAEVVKSDGSRPEQIVGSISVDLLRPIKDGEELTISYIDNTFPLSRRQSDLNSRYFFTCTCARCSQGTSTIFDKLLISPISGAGSEAESNAIAILDAATSKPSPLPTMIPVIRSALSRLAKTSTFPVHRYPYAPLRLQLILALIASNQWHEAMLQSGILVYRVDPLLYSQLHHPIRVVNKWRLYRLAFHLLTEMLDAEDVSANSEAHGIFLKTTLIVLIMSLQAERPKGTVPMPPSALERMLSEAKAEVTEGFLGPQRLSEKPAMSGSFAAVLEAYRRNQQTVENSLKEEWEILIAKVLRKEAVFDDEDGEGMTEHCRPLEIEQRMRT